MKTNGWIASSQRLYRWLLRLYPQEYRTTYEGEMFHVFTDQCREAYKGRGKLGILSLWLRTLVDVGVTVVREHLSDPHARAGLLEATPNAPLPWKGVLLVLIPGLIFFVSQIVQLTTSEDWFFIAFYRAAYFLMLPVLLVWFLTRRFPVWGLIPFGLLYGTLRSYNPGYLISKLPFFGYPGKLDLFGITFDPNYLIPVSACAVLLSVLIWYNARRRQIPRAAWIWLGLYILLIIFQIIGDAYRTIAWQVAWQDLDWQAVANSIDIKQHMAEMPFWYLYDSLSFLLLVFIGKVFARKHGGLSFLVLLGYLLPTIIFGRYGTWNENIPFYMVSLAVLIYRFVVALVAPVWLVRAASLPGRQRAAAIPVAIAIVCHVSLNLLASLALDSQYGYSTSPLDLAIYIWGQLIIAAGLGLAVVLYLPKTKMPDQTVVSPPTLTAMTE